MNKELKLKIIRERGPYCEYCQVRQGTQLHHCLIRRDKRFPELDCEQNLMLCCAYCHTEKRLLDSWEVSLAFWDIQCARYGKQEMLNWLKELPLRSKPNFQ